MAYRAPLAAAPQVSYPLERVSADLMELEVTSQANRMIKRTNGVVKNALATLLEASPLEWDELLPYIRLTMNSAVHRSVGDQPLYLLTGHIVTYPVGNSNYEETDHEAAQSFAARLRRAREIAVETSVQAREGWAWDYNRRTRKSTFAAEVGDLVLFKDLPRMVGVERRGALGPRWFGLARILKKTGPVTRLIRVLSSPYKEKIYHLNQQRPYRTNDELHLSDDAEIDEDGDVDDPPPLDGLPDDDPAVALLASFCRPPDDG
ncbi:uncharacterized protein LOC119599192 [Penaeus monodon]|uniref:uncharacterized protein LOC119599192 n=1 Tax=Penaeus monodon TaxID=6687 RepID=UPI0018A7399D|nr:uncharacterized protein LOC119599192 [Penaeus monodon]